jgi:hypothetical protein
VSHCNASAKLPWKKIGTEISAVSVAHLLMASSTSVNCLAGWLKNPSALLNPDKIIGVP